MPRRPGPACPHCHQLRLPPGRHCRACGKPQPRAGIRFPVDALRIAVLFGAVVFGWLRLKGYVGDG